MSMPENISPYGPPPMPSFIPPDESGANGLGQAPLGYQTPDAGPGQVWPGVPYEAPPVAYPPAMPMPDQMPVPGQMPSPMPMPGSLYPPVQLPDPPGPYGRPFGLTNTGLTAKNWMGAVAMICSILASAFIFSLSSGNSTSNGVTGLIWILVSISAVAFGAAGVRAAGRHEATNRGFAMTGLIVGSVWCGLIVIAFILVAMGAI